MRNRRPAGGRWIQSNQMAKRAQLIRVLALTGALCAFFVVLGYRLVSLQVLQHEDLGKLARSNTQREFLREPHRGDIVDVKGNALATSVFVKTVCADPVLIGNRQNEITRAIAPVLQLDPGELFQRLQLTTRTNAEGRLTTNRYSVLKRKVSAESWAKVQQAMSNLTFNVDEKLLPKKERTFYKDLREKAVFADSRDDQLRVYPNSNLLAHVLGYVGMAEAEYNGARIIETAGMDGIEKSLNSKLAGVRGWRETETDSRKREVVWLREQDVAPRDGCNVVLTIDSVIQSIVEKALWAGMEKHKPISITCIVTRPRTGEILAMATLPTYDPNDLSGSIPDHRRNRVITDMVEPGSTFKIVVVSGALDRKKVKLTDRIFCENGAFPFAGRVLHDHDPYGSLSVEEIVTKSSNIGAAKIGIQLGGGELHGYIKDFGFGTRTGIPLTGEHPGLVYPTNKWSKVSIAQIPMGHGLCATRLQMVMAMSAIANKGKLMRPMLLDRLTDEDGHTLVKYGPQSVRQVISEDACRKMVQALKTVVGKGGTAPGAALEHYTVAGKTGTAQKVENGAYVSGKYISSFIGFFPADNPELCISVVLDEPKGLHYGGQTAAPVFKQIAEGAASYLNIRPDRVEEPGRLPMFEAGAEGRPVRTASARPQNN